MSNTMKPRLRIPVTGPAMHRVWVPDSVGKHFQFAHGPRGEWAVRTGCRDSEGDLWLVRSGGRHDDLGLVTGLESGLVIADLPLTMVEGAAPVMTHPMLGALDEMIQFVPNELLKTSNFSGLEWEDFGHLSRWHCHGTLADSGHQRLHANLWMDVESGSPIINCRLMLSASEYRDRVGDTAPAGEIGSYHGDLSFTFGDKIVTAVPKGRMMRVGAYRHWRGEGNVVKGHMEVDFGAWVVIEFCLSVVDDPLALGDEDQLWLQNAARWGTTFYGLPERPEWWLGERPVTNRAGFTASCDGILRYQKAIASGFEGGAYLLTDDRPFTPYNAGGQAGSQPHLGATFSSPLWRLDEIDPDIVNTMHWAALEKLLRPEKSWEPGRPGVLWRASQHPDLRYDDGQPHRRGRDTLQFPGADSEALPRFSRFGNFTATPDTHREEELVVAAAKLTGCPALRLYLEHWVEGFKASGRRKDGWAQIPRASGRRCRSYLNAIGVTGTGDVADAEADLVLTWKRGDEAQRYDELWTPAVDSFMQNGKLWWSPYEHAQMLHAACRIFQATPYDHSRDLIDCIEGLATGIAVSLVNLSGQKWALPYHCQVIEKPAPVEGADEPDPVPPAFTPRSPEVRMGSANWLAWGGCGIGAAIEVIESSDRLFLPPELFDRLVEAHAFLKLEGTHTAVDCDYALVEVEG